MKDIDIIHIGSYHLEMEYLILLCPSNSYTVGLDSTTWIERRIFKEFDPRKRELWTEKHLFTNG
jgi:hypothetical protein